MAAVSQDKGRSIIADISLASLAILVVAILMIPLPTGLIDLFLVINLSASILILLTALNIIDPLEFAVFPQLLLVTTLFRLSLNVATSRSILLNADAGKVVETFAQFVIGGNYVVGIVVFLILMIIQFIVITEGAKRVAEVAARFTLDAMPGKQMSIDADFNAGLIDAEEAKKRRKDLEKGSNFFGTMDGANKFVRGDAIAGIIITIVNILGGFAIGVLQKGMELTEAAARYTTLSIGDGLVAIIPGFLISISAGFVTTRAISESNLAFDLKTQLFASYKSLAMGAVFIFGFGFIPGMPTHFFIALSITLVVVAFVVYRKSVKKAQMVVEEEEDSAIPEQEVKKPENVLQVMEVHPLALEMGLDLIPLVDPSQGGDLLDRVVPMRVQIAMELGFVMPGIQFKDNLNLRPNEYSIKVKGIEVARGEILMGYMLAIQQPDTDVSQELVGFPTKDPAFGTPAVWVAGYEAQRAAQLGYMVTDPTNVLITHVAEIVKTFAHEILSRQEVQVMINKVKEKHPVVVKELIPDLLSLGGVQKVLQNLIRERVSIRDLATILEKLTDFAKINQDPDTLSELARQSLSRQICNNLSNEQNIIPVITLDPKVEQAVQESIQQTAQGAVLALNPQVSQQILAKLANEVQAATNAGHNPVVLCNPQIRPHVKKLTERNFPMLTVLSYNEIAPKIKIQSIGAVTISFGS
ncbi:flagellar biosynthesis protein FlhA [bacterium (Candidatus Blackallbacteria) CG17_big_fil_post_rev_8_21_14_2_50_48_46]|uniref:Flagellar biosynthesis protein FlhA n=1 Tax=bacterium (Candidatus Blackallbacteria) CG17_big_fil_post_rev_8_21_14_2_50_48_46 TaxID=2014261 RepID=A0A2M7G811_9BACT|nr:MAG: flagellar biosynthesis protein FlhA [bacterium (Candidatus Blackallbacteria) CG18_big_fil_WC_8_21_14_2_50_49_26]PIW18143.1 MAG: flagellar biosynthesis protein FlhA [bacterium (Candidatus Blackallbacteria) CG17_big_fil_post_rev_8_21_14_2_50_48_46]PIW47022.1 MAG: flagellar biosynthesis protein FlhA [bacterium (Candidatus Blackallbacteria) CG13_big_fil_rev_8_21_14_2_50_49_14]